MLHYEPRSFGNFEKRLKTSMSKQKKINLSIPIIMVLTLGFAPYTPEPHIWGKIKWVIGGAKGMQPMDWFDLMLHGAPWIFLIAVLVIKLKEK